MLSLCFRPEVEFNIRLLKAVQLMEFPLLKSWVANLVNDCLKLCKCIFIFPNLIFGSTLEFVFHLQAEIWVVYNRITGKNSSIVNIK